MGRIILNTEGIKKILKSADAPDLLAAAQIVSLQETGLPDENVIIDALLEKYKDGIRHLPWRNADALFYDISHSLPKQQARLVEFGYLLFDNAVNAKDYSRALNIAKWAEARFTDPVKKNDAITRGLSLVEKSVAEGRLAKQPEAHRLMNLADVTAYWAYEHSTASSEKQVVVRTLFAQVDEMILVGDVVLAHDVSKWAYECFTDPIEKMRAETRINNLTTKVRELRTELATKPVKMPPALSETIDEPFINIKALGKFVRQLKALSPKKRTFLSWLGMT